MIRVLRSIEACCSLTSRVELQKEVLLYADRHAENQLTLWPSQLEMECLSSQRGVFEVVRLSHAHELARSSKKPLRRRQIETVFGELPPAHDQCVVLDPGHAVGA